jgi:hypothetical protein
MLPVGAPEENLLSTSFSFWWPQGFPSGHIASSSFVCLSFVRSFLIGFGAWQDNSGTSHLKILDFILSANTFSPIKLSHLQLPEF